MTCDSHHFALVLPIYHLYQYNYKLTPMEVLNSKPCRLHHCSRSDIRQHCGTTHTNVAMTHAIVKASELTPMIVTLICWFMNLISILLEF